MESRIKNSLNYWERAEKVIPGGTQTLSKGPNMFTFGVYPVYLEKGKGSHVWDVDGNEYIDYPLALGPITLGYDYPAVTEAVQRQLREGTTFTLMHPLEVEVSELLVDVIPCAEMVRFAKNGSDVTSAAVRLARTYTGREHVLCCGYHGWQDWYIASTEHNVGIPSIVSEYIHTFKYNDIESLKVLFEKLKGKVAAVIMEPVSINLPEDDFLQKVKDIAHENGAVLIFDEIVTGFRLALGGAQEYFNVTPDLATVGKGMANGLPISALVGKKEIMQSATKMFFSTTFGGETLSLAAAKATIEEMRKKDVHTHFWKLGETLKSGTQKLVDNYELNKYIKVTGPSPKFWIDFVAEDGSEYDELKGLFFQECILNGVLIGGLQYISFSHTEVDISKTLEAFEIACKKCKQSLQDDSIGKLLLGVAPGNVFKRHKSSN